MDPGSSRPSPGSKVKQRLREKASQLEDLLSQIELDDRPQPERPRVKKAGAKAAGPAAVQQPIPRAAAAAQGATPLRAPQRPRADPPRRTEEAPRPRQEGPPPQKFEVLALEAAVHKWPEGASAVVGWKRRGDRVEATEETFDGWARLAAGEGWLLRESPALGGPGTSLQPLGARALELPAPLVAKEPGRQMFEVVGSPEVHVFAQPSPGAASSSARAVGEVVLADTQSYNGWLRLAGNAGWMPASSPRRGELMRCLYEEQEAALAAQKERLAEERARQEAEEALVDLEIQRARQSSVWRRLQEPAAPAPIGRCDRLPLRPRGGPPPPKLPSGLLLQEFRVLPEDGAVVRLKPNGEAPVCGVKRQGELLLAGEETFNGWVKLAEGPGWILRDLAGEGGVGAVLASPGGGQELLVPELARVPGRQLFEVEADPGDPAEAGLPVLREPEDGALVLGSRSVGEVVLAETQSYHGWVKLSDEEGWIRGRPAPGGGRCWLRCMRQDELQLCIRNSGGDTLDGEAAADEAEAVAAAEAAQREEAMRREARLHLEEVARSGNTVQFCAALETARERGVAKADLARANALRKTA